ncbi:15679_t:CDS:2, partial [Funneliformis geosporum]
MEIFKGISEETFEEIQEQEESTPEIVSVLKKSKGRPSRKKNNLGRVLSSGFFLVSLWAGFLFGSLSEFCFGIFSCKWLLWISGFCFQVFRRAFFLGKFPVYQFVSRSDF